MSQKQSIQTNPNGTVPLDQPDPEVVVPAKRRQFTVAEKLRILDEVDRCEPGQIGASLRREGLYSSHLTKWCRQWADVAGEGRHRADRRPRLGKWASGYVKSESLREVTSAWRKLRGVFEYRYPREIRNSLYDSQLGRDASVYFG